MQINFMAIADFIENGLIWQYHEAELPARTHERAKMHVYT